MYLVLSRDMDNVVISPRWGGWALREMLKVELTGRRYAELTLPATPYAVLDALEKLELEEVGAPGWDVIDFCGNKSILKYLDKDGTLFELNALCQQLALLDEGQLAIVEGLAKMGYEKDSHPIPIPRLIDMAHSTDRCHHVEEATDDYTLGRFCAENGFVPEADDLPDEAFELLDFVRIGREFRQEEGGVFTSGGYVQKRDELRQMYENLDLTLKKPDYTVLAETSSGCEVRFPVPANEPMGTEPVRCVDCAAPALIGISGGMESMDLLADENGGKLKNRVVLFCDEFGTMPPFDVLSLFSAGRSRKLTMLPIIQSLAQLDKNYGKEGSEIIQDNCQTLRHEVA